MFTNESTADMVAKTGVGAVGTFYSYLHMPLSQWVALATLLYMICQLIVILPKVGEVFKKFFRKERNARKAKSTPKE